MKLIIEIDEKTYNKFKKGITDIEGNLTVRKAVRNGTPLQAEFEEIKEEIEKCYYNDSPEVDGVIIFKEDVNNIFSKRITELKGEKE